ncbi:O-antigen ligase family protein [Rubritalea spongiae]|uniref:O-antigen ligase family protein n=1 Tax=Rubritalea spongiae TaxID=430797 RepID=A0ABW5E1F7_9BACT
MMNRLVHNTFWSLQGLLLLIGYLLCVTVATWDRPEAMAPYVAVLAVAGVLAVLGVAISKRLSLGGFDATVLCVAGYFGWRAWGSPVALYGQTDLVLILSAVLMWFTCRTFSELGNVAKRVWLVAMLLMLGANIAASWYQLNVDLRWCLFVERTERAVMPSGIFTHRNYFGNFAAVAALSCLGLLFGKSSGLLVRVLSAIVVVGNLVLLGMCASRGAFVSVAVGLTVFFMFYAIHLWNAGKMKKPVVVAGFSLLAIVAAGAAYSQFGRLDQSRGWTAHGGQVQDSGRKDFSSLAVDQFFEAPLLGSGAHSVEWRSVALLSKRGEGALGTLNYAHNEYFQVLCDYGLVGFVLLLCLIFGYGGRLVFSLLKREDMVWGMAVFAAFVAFCVHCFFSFPAHIPANLLTIVAVCALGWPSLKSSEGVRKWLVRVPVLVVMLIGAAYGAQFAWKEWPAFQLYTKFNDTMELSDWEPELRQQAEQLESVVGRAPNFKRYRRVGGMYNALYQKSGDLADFEKSAEYYILAAELYPMSPDLRLSEAGFMAVRGEYAQAEEAYKFAIENGVSQQRWLYPYWKYGLYCYQRGNSLWLEREAEMALEYFLQAQELLAKARPPREERKRFSEIQKELKARVDLLESVF